MESYLTIKSPGQGSYKEKGSKFLSFAFSAKDPDEVQGHLNQLKKEYHDARHHCYAFILGIESQQHRANDDGEPGHSAGDPILGQIKSRELTNTLVVVVRYFGGTKLGVSGLIRAYKTAAQDALDNCSTQRITITQEVQLQFPYEITSPVMKLIKDFQLKIINQDFDENCRVTAAIKPALRPGFDERAGLLTRLKVNYT